MTALHSWYQSMQRTATQPSTTPAGRSRERTFKAVALVVGSIVALGLLELGCRLFSPIYLGPPDYFTNFFVPDAELGYRMPDNFSGLYRQDYELTYTTNAHGLRDRDFDAHAAPGVTRILALGDSWTFGLGVDLPETWPKQLERALHERGVEAEVINAGVSGYSTMTYAKGLKKFLAIYHPHAVIVMTCANDPGGDLSVAEQNFTFAVKPTPAPWREFLKKHSHLAMNLRVAYVTLMTPKNSYSLMNTLTLRAADDPMLRRGYALYEAALREMQDVARDSGLPYFLTAVPMGDGFLARTAEIARAGGIPYISLEALKDDASIDGHNSAGHYNPEGYRRIADLLAGALEVPLREAAATR